jgi:hypothetical protein
VTRPLLSALLPLFSLLLAGSAVSRPSNTLVARGRTEPVVAVAPGRSSTIIVGANPNYGAPVRGTLPVGVFASHDGGRTFQSGLVPTTGRYSDAADPTVKIAASGTIFYSFVGVAPGTYDCKGCSCTQTTQPRAAILVSRSIDHGRSFKPPTIVSVNPNGDRPSMAIESRLHHRAHLFLSWTRSSRDIWYARSLNGGASFSAARQLYQSDYGTVPAIPVVAGKGHIFVVWIQTGGANLPTPIDAQIMMRASTDDGAHFGPVQTVVPWFKTMPRMVQPGSLRTPPLVAAAGDHRGNLYLTWAAVKKVHADGSVNADIDIIRSVDGGVTWTAPKRVNDVRSGDRFMPAMSVFPDGSVGVAFYDRRVGLNSLGVFTAHVSFADGFHRSANVRVNQRYAAIAFIHTIPQGSSCYSPGRFFGDYMGTSAPGASTLDVTWADSGLGIREETDVWFAKVRLPALPG